MSSSPKKIWQVRKSDIHGEGIFIEDSVYEGTKIDTAINFTLGLIPNVTFFASKLNHSYTPTATLVYDDDNKTYDVFAKYDLPKDTEITIDYRETPYYIEGPKDFFV